MIIQCVDVVDWDSAALIRLALMRCDQLCRKVGGLAIASLTYRADMPLQSSEAALSMDLSSAGKDLPRTA